MEEEMQERTEEEIEQEIEKQKDEQQEQIEEENRNMLLLLYMGLFAFIKKAVFDTYSRMPGWNWQEINKFKRLDKLLLQINSEIDKYKKEQTKLLRKSLIKNFTDFYNSMTLLLGAEPKGWKREKIEEEIDFPWSGMSFSERIWKNQEQLKQRLKETLIESAVNEESIQQLTKRLEKEFKTSYNNAKRLVETEHARVQYLADMKAFEEEGVKKVKYNAKFDKSCKECQSLHGKVYRLGKQPSLPRHAHCKCFYTPVE